MTTVSPAPVNLLGNSFGPAQTAVLEQHIRERVPFYVRMQISSFEARLSFLLNELVNIDRTPSVPFYAFFCSSASEAISGSLKIVRHNHFAHKPTQPNITAVYDPTGGLQEMFNPMSAGIDDALVPGLTYFENIDSFREYVLHGNPSSVLIRRGEDLNIDVIAEILSEAKARNIYTILDESSNDLAKHLPLSAQLQTLPDVIAFGENLGNHRVPTGCFLMSHSIYQVWDNVKEYNLHSNTWGGNSISLATVLAFLKTTPGFAKLPATTGAMMQQAVDSHQTATKLYATHCSPKMAKMLGLGGLNKDIRSAYQARIETVGYRGPQSVIDASGTYGVNLQGHNPAGVIDAVVACHDVDHDYWLDLQELLHRKTGLAHILPAVSGATSVEAAIAAGVMAAAPKKKVVALTGGFGGKTMVSMIGTSRERFKTPFGPLYPHVSYINPFTSEGRDELLRELAADDVAVVIMEMVQGEGGVRAVPQDFLDFLSDQKERYGFFIAVDEVQTGMYRTGRFLNYQGRVQADIVAMGKAMSDNVFPVSGALVSDQVYRQAQQTNAAALARYANTYRCQFGAHMAIHAIESGESLGLAEHALKAGEHFRARLREITKDLDFVKEVRGEGLMIGIEFDEPKLPGLLRSNFGGLIASRCVNDPKQPVLVAFNPDKPFLIRFVPPLCITMAEIDAVIATFDRALHSGMFGLLKPIVINTINAKLGRS
jgi:acetylornithine/succinyldiaminopimelate/putrescine aminotransferase